MLDMHVQRLFGMDAMIRTFFFVRFFGSLRQQLCSASFVARACIRHTDRSNESHYTQKMLREYWRARELFIADRLLGLSLSLGTQTGAALRSRRIKWPSRLCKIGVHVCPCS